MGGTMSGRALKHWSTTQPNIALSSGEAELGGIVKGASVGLGFQSMAADLGIAVKLKIHSDSSAAIGISRRRGLGKIRHLAVGDLWIQKRLRNGDFQQEKVQGSENPADILTKHTEKSTMFNMLPKLNLTFEAGRADSASKVCAVYYKVNL